MSGMLSHLVGIDRICSTSYRISYNLKNTICRKMGQSGSGFLDLPAFQVCSLTRELLSF